MNSPKNGDAIFAILVVAFLCLVILFISVSIVFLGFKLSFLPEMQMENRGFLENLWFVVQFIGSAFIFFLIAERMSKNLIDGKNKFLSTAVQYAYTFTLCWFFTQLSESLSTSSLGIFYIAIFLFCPNASHRIPVFFG